MEAQGSSPPESVPTEEAETLGLQNAELDETATPDEGLETEVVPDDDATLLKQKVAEYEAKLEEQKAKEYEREQAVAAAMERLEREKDEKAAAELLASLEDNDPELAEQFKQNRGYLVQKLTQTQQENQKFTNAIEALTLALEKNHPDIVQAVIDEAQTLMDYPDYQAKLDALERRKAGQKAESERVQSLEKQLAELQLKLDAASRPKGADAVEGGTTGAGATSEWQTAGNFEDFFAGLARDIA